MSILETRLIEPSVPAASKISGIKFIVKDYQRGYRWGEKQVKDLLDDIFEFDSNSHKTKYCMQPLIVKKINDETVNNSLNNSIRRLDISQQDVETKEVYELIDGQQRLTTLLLIMSRCDANFLPYVISYSLFREIDKNYIDNAIDTIDKWFNSHFTPVNMQNKKFEMRGKILEDLQFIWYEVDASANSKEIFTKINAGKIPLTNAELFKALLLNPDFGNTSRIELDKIAMEWDYIEQSLRDDEFWGFISKENIEPRIDLLLRLYALREKNKNSSLYDDLKIEDPLFPFLLVCEKLKGHTNKFTIIKQIWIEEIVALHDILKSWYNDVEFYHYIGFLVQVAKNPLDCLIHLIVDSYGKKKSETKNIVWEKIKDEFRNVVIDDLDFDDKEKVRKVLLFFNIYTMIKSKTKTKFSFKQYNDMKWNIEHIHSRADESELRKVVTFAARKVLLDSLKEQFGQINNLRIVAEIDDYIDNELSTADADGFVTFYTDKADTYGRVDINSIGNFTLLDEETNKSYHNSLYPIKRNIIIEKDKGEVFIPVCTKNAFLKMYSKNTGDPMAWTFDDARDYSEAIKKSLVEEAQVCQ